MTVEKCCINCGHFRNGRCYCQEELQADNRTYADVFGIILDDIENGKIDSFVDEIEKFTSFNGDFLEQYKLSKPKKRELLNHILAQNEDLLMDFKVELADTMANYYDRNRKDQPTMNIFHVTNPREFYCSRFWR